MWETLVAFGVPSACLGLVIWFFKRYIDKRDEAQAKKDKVREEREARVEEFMLRIMKSSQANYILSEATARAVQRIPDAHCNGDMTAALINASELLKEEKEFLEKQGIDRVFGSGN